MYCPFKFLALTLKLEMIKTVEQLFTEKSVNFFYIKKNYFKLIFSSRSFKWKNLLSLKNQIYF